MQMTCFFFSLFQFCFCSCDVLILPKLMHHMQFSRKPYSCICSSTQCRQFQSFLLCAFMKKFVADISRLGQQCKVRQRFVLFINIIFGVTLSPQLLMLIFIGKGYEWCIWQWLLSKLILIEIAAVSFAQKHNLSKKKKEEEMMVYRYYPTMIRMWTCCCYMIIYLLLAKGKG